MSGTDKMDKAVARADKKHERKLQEILNDAYRCADSQSAKAFVRSCQNFFDKTRHLTDAQIYRLESLDDGYQSAYSEEFEGVDTFEIFDDFRHDIPNFGWQG